MYSKRVFLATTDGFVWFLEAGVRGLLEMKLDFRERGREGEGGGYYRNNGNTP